MEKLAVQLYRPPVKVSDFKNVPAYVWALVWGDLYQKVSPTHDPEKYAELAGANDDV